MILVEIASYPSRAHCDGDDGEDDGNENFITHGWGEISWMMAELLGKCEVMRLSVRAPVVKEQATIVNSRSLVACYAMLRLIRIQLKERRGREGFR